MTLFDPRSPRGHLSTERPLPESEELDRLTTAEAVALMNREDAHIAEAVARAGPEVARAIDLIAERMAAGGRLFYVGAGTSGRLGVMDAAECPPTFQVPRDRVQAVIAGGPDAITRSVERSEDSVQEARRELAARELSARDVVFGIAAGGTTAFVHGALDFARENGAATVFLACVSADEVPDQADVSIRVVTGPEVLTGSTRLKAGTATKMVLGTVSTLVMTRLGKVYGNRMVDVDTRGNTKLRDRGMRLVSELAGVSLDSAGEWLDSADGQVKTAVLMARFGIERAQAEERLQRAGGYLRGALNHP